jgi:hypothetical protein
MADASLLLPCRTGQLTRHEERTPKVVRTLGGAEYFAGACASFTTLHCAQFASDFMKADSNIHQIPPKLLIFPQNIVLVRQNAASFSHRRHRGLCSARYFRIYSL